VTFAGHATVSVISGGIVTGVGGCGVELGGGVDGVCVAPALERGTTIPNSRIILSDDFPRSSNLTMGASSWSTRGCAIDALPIPVMAAVVATANMANDGPDLIIVILPAN